MSVFLREYFLSQCSPKAFVSQVHTYNKLCGSCTGFRIAGSFFWSSPSCFVAFLSTAHYIMQKWSKTRPSIHPNYKILMHDIRHKSSFTSVGKSYKAGSWPYAVYLCDWQSVTQCDVTTGMSSLKDLVTDLVTGRTGWGLIRWLVYFAPLSLGKRGVRGDTLDKHMWHAQSDY